MSERNKLHPKTLMATFVVGPFLGVFSLMALFGDSIMTTNSGFGLIWIFGSMLLTGIIVHNS